MPPTDPLDAEIAAHERLFRRNGLPLLVENFSARDHVFPMAAPYFALFLLVEALTSINTKWSIAANVLAVLGAAALIVVGWVLMNLLRRNPWRHLPTYLGLPELAFFVLAPLVVNVVFGGYWTAGMIMAAWNFLVILFTWLVVGYGLLASAWWGLGRLLDELGASLLRLIRFLPLLLVFSLVLFYNAEIWQVFDQAPDESTWLLGAFFALVIGGIVVLRVPHEAREVLRDAAVTVPDRARATSFTRAQRANLTVMIAVSQLLQVVVISAGMGIFFVALGMLTITPDVMELWQVDGGTWSQTVSLGDAHLVLSASLMRVAIAIATFTGLYYAISVQVDPVYRDEFVDGLGSQMRDVVQARVEYLELCDRRRARAADTAGGGAAGGAGGSRPAK